MASARTLERVRESYAHRAWGDAYVGLTAADRETPLDADDLERLATAAYLIGEDEVSTDVWARAHRAFLDRGDPERAVRCAFWLAFALLQNGEQARASGWLARARRLLDDAGRESVEVGYLLLPGALQRIFAGDDAGAFETFEEAAGIGQRYADPDLVGLARHGCGRALIRMGRIDEGVTLLDEAMASVEAGEVSPVVAGDIYCSVIEACHEIFDMQRAQEWTEALGRWCESQPDLVLYRGQCLVRRAEIMRLHGAWPDAMEEACRACEHLVGVGQRAAGAAYYQRAELHRLRGEWSEAEEAYSQASRWGRKPQPGLALLRLAQGRLDDAVSAIRLVVSEAKERRDRSRLLAAYVEIVLAAGDTESARAAAHELARIADELGAPFLRATADHATGAVRLAADDPSAALETLRDASEGWRVLDAPYEEARTRVLIATACRALGDEDGAAMALDAAGAAFGSLSATPDMERVRRLSRAESAGGLTARQVQVLRLLATGQSNRHIAQALFLSERTIERHVSNIFTRLRVSSRAAATAYAYEHDLV